MLRVIVYILHFLNPPPRSQYSSRLGILWKENKSLIEGRVSSMFSASASPAGSNGICKPMKELRRCWAGGAKQPILQALGFLMGCVGAAL